MERSALSLIYFLLLVSFLGGSGSEKISLKRHSLNSPSTIQEVVSGNTQNLRSDIRDALRSAILEEKILQLKEFIQQSLQSELDFFVFMISTHYLIQQEPPLGGKLEGLLRRIHQEDLINYARGSHASVSERERFSAYLNWVRVFVRQSYRKDSELIENTSSSEDGRLFYLDYSSAVRLQFPHQWSDDFSTADIHAAIHEFLFTNNSDFLLNSSRDASNDRRVSLGAIRFPTFAIRIQSGGVQKVYLILIPLHDGRLIPFTLLVAKSFSKSHIVREEFRDLFQNRHDSHVVRVFRLTSVPRGKEEIAAYSSNFLNNFAEVFLKIIKAEQLNSPRENIFVLNSNHPDRDAVCSESSKSEILAQIVKLIVYFYNPESQTMIEGFNVSAGDVNFPENLFDISFSSDDEWQASLRSDPEDSHPILIAWRGNQKGVNVLNFLQYLFNLRYMGYVREVIVSKDMDGNNETFLKGVLAGLRLGLIEKYGKIKGLRKSQSWLNLYLDAVKTKRVSRDRLFSPRPLRAFLRQIEEELNSLDKTKSVREPVENSL